jgi:hypothetical protein
VKRACRSPGWSTAEALNATGDMIETDGKMAVLLL